MLYYRAGPIRLKKSLAANAPRRRPSLLKFTAPFLFAALLASGARPTRGDERAAGLRPEETDGPVKISILSKHLRLMKEGRAGSIVITLPAGAVIESADTAAPVPAGTIVMVHAGGFFRLSVDHLALSPPARLRVLVPGKKACCDVTIDNEKRAYPLPIEINYRDDGISVIAAESLSRYCLDAARAEMGPVHSRANEAVQALALLIRARYQFTRRAAPHREADFCDLTHCQVYRGRLGADGPLPSEPWVIDTRSLDSAPLFHARCGGHTLGNGVFKIGGGRRGEVKDWISSEGLMLCRPGEHRWEAALSPGELAAIITGRPSPGGMPVSLEYDRTALVITLRRGGEIRRYAPEDFRLRINRVRGWGFLKSNLYTVRREGEGPFIFSGAGLGHGAGLCQHGALELARRGYSRYEILRHYYPDAGFAGRLPVSEETPSNLSFVVFSLSTGETVRASFPSLRYRRVPAGSLIKLFVALYCGAKREDLLRDYRYTCTGKNSGPETEPKRCWTPRGHGQLDFPGALRDSCNLYFASLHDRISRKDFFDFCRDLSTRLGLDLRLPPINDNKEFSRLLSGTDFRATLSIQSLITLARLVGPVQTAADPIERYRFGVPPASRKLLTGALYETVRSGTAAGPLHPFGPEENCRGLMDVDTKKHDGAPTAPLWGKTSTVLSGTNTCQSYGIFMGGDEDLGIITLLRRGNGHTAARWAVSLLRPD